MTDSEVSETASVESPVPPETLYALTPVLSIADLKRNRDIIREAFEVCMTEGIDYGVIPGTSGKPTLLLPGAQQIALLFGFTEEYEQIEIVQDILGTDHDGEPFIHFAFRCDIYKNGKKLGSGFGCCNSWEKKYRYRTSDRACPLCGAEAILKSKQDDGYFCWKKRGGCGETFSIDDPRVINQQTGQKANPDVMEVVNTILKISKKRAFVDGVLYCSGASSHFTQDIEDMSTINKDVKEGEGIGRTRQNTQPEAKQKPAANPPSQQKRSENAPESQDLTWGQKYVQVAEIFGIDSDAMDKPTRLKFFQRLLGMQKFEWERRYELCYEVLHRVLIAYGSDPTPQGLRTVVESAIGQPFADLSEVDNDQWIKVIDWLEAHHAGEHTGPQYFGDDEPDPVDGF